jgi:hypothetical protein
MGLINMVGQGLSLVGLIMLFYFGMPFHVPTKGKSFLLLEETDFESLKKEQSYSVGGYIGFGLSVLGTALQMYVSFKTTLPFWPWA